MENRIITISREYGSGGRAIGRKLADKLGIHCYDAELIQKIVEKSGYPADYVKEKGEDAEGGGLSMFLVDRRLGPTHQDTLWKIQSQVISELADKESCVIVGRCADYILQARADASNASSTSMASRRKRRTNGSRIGISAEWRITTTTRTRSGEMQRTTTSALIVERWESISVSRFWRSCIE